MAIVNHMKGTSIHLRHSSLSQTRQKFNSHICQLLWQSWERTPACAHEAVRQLKDSACVEIRTNARHRASQPRKPVRVSACVLLSDDLAMIIDIRLSDTCKQGRRRPHGHPQPAVYHSASLQTRTGSAFTLSHRLTSSRPLSLPAPYQHSQLLGNSFEKQLLRTAVPLLIGLTLSFSVCVCVCVDVLASH